MKKATVKSDFKKSQPNFSLNVPVNVMPFLGGLEIESLSDLCVIKIKFSLLKTGKREEEENINRAQAECV